MRFLPPRRRFAGTYRYPVSNAKTSNNKYNHHPLGSRFETSCRGFGEIWPIGDSGIGQAPDLHHPAVIPTLGRDTGPPFAVLLYDAVNFTDLGESRNRGSDAAWTGNRAKFMRRRPGVTRDRTWQITANRDMPRRGLPATRFLCQVESVQLGPEPAGVGVPRTSLSL